MLWFACHRRPRGSSAILHHVFVGISWVSNFFLCIYRGSKFSFRGYFLGPEFSLVGNFVIFSCFIYISIIHKY